ncbi:MAG: ftsH, partial [Verrucomicrobiaceae bacterium]|nr:ftsH [Verrucomicrobiaceae bacterium]
VEYGDEEGTGFMAPRSRGYSEHTAQQIDEEVKRLIDEAYAKATQLLTQYRDKLDAIALALLEYETLDGVHIKDIMTTGKMSNPPPTSTKPPSPPPIPKAIELRPVRQPDGESGLAPGLAGAPA